MPWLRRLKKWLGGRRPPSNLIIIGVGYPSFTLGQAAQVSGHFRILAFIDDEPWNHRTQLIGATVHYPSELIALIKRHDVHCVAGIEGEPPEIADDLWADVLATGAVPVLLSAGSGAEAHLQQLITATSLSD